MNIKNAKLMKLGINVGEERSLLIFEIKSGCWRQDLANWRKSQDR